MVVMIGAGHARPQDTDKAAATPYEKWLKEDVVYIITNEERAAFKNLQTDEEREHFIEQFWDRRNPTPGSADNPFKQEHYRRIAYANRHFADAAATPGWKMDRGRIYIVYGPPDEIYARTLPDPTHNYEHWRYNHIDGIGNNVIIEFDDPDGSGAYRMAADPHGSH